MGFLEKKKSRQEFQESYKSDSSGAPKQSGSLARKRESIIRTYEEPVLPKLAKILFISMIVLTVVMIAVDLKNGLLYIGQLGLVRILGNLSQTAMMIWLIYTVPIALVCGIGMRRNIVIVRRKALEGASGILSKEDVSRCSRSAHRLNKPYRVYLLCCLIGVAAWIAFYVVVHYFL